MPESTQISSISITTGSPAATLRLGRKIGAILSPHSLLALVGELGCGKTLLTRGVCAGLGVPEGQVNSPTFILVNEYRGRLPVYHMDLYRLGDGAESLDIGLMDYISRREPGIIIVEWAEKAFAVLPGDYLLVRLEITGKRQRRLTLEDRSGRYREIISLLGEK